MEMVGRIDGAGVQGLMDSWSPRHRPYRSAQLSWQRNTVIFL